MPEQLRLLNKDPKASHYYDVGGISVADVLRAKLTPSKLDGFSNSIIFNIVKYALRLPFKGTALRDAEKILQYAEMLVDAIRNYRDGSDESVKPGVEAVEVTAPQVVDAKKLIKDPAVLQQAVRDAQAALMDHDAEVAIVEVPPAS